MSSPNKRDRQASISSTTAKKKPKIADTTHTEAGNKMTGADEAETAAQTGPKKSVANKGRAARKNRAAPTSLLGQTNGDTDQKCIELADLLLQSNDPFLANSKRLAKILKETKLTKMVKPEIPDVEQRLDQMLRSLTPMTKRNIQYAGSAQRQAASWVITMRDRSPEGFKALDRIETTFSIGYDRLANDDANRPTAQQIGEQIRQIVSVWPWPFKGTDRLTKATIRDLACDRIFGTSLQRIMDVVADATVYSISITFYDPSDGKPRQRVVKMSPSDVLMAHIAPPPLPPMILLTGQARTAKEVKHGKYPILKAPPSLETTSSAASQAKAQSLLRYIGWKCHGLVTTSTNMDKLVNYWQGVLGYKGRVSRGMYGGSALYHITVRSRERTVFVGPSTAVATDLVHQNNSMNRHLIDIRVRSLIVARITPVLDALIQVYVATADVRRAWLCAARIADMVNKEIAEGIPPSSACDCDETATGTELHSCERCLNAVLCKTRVHDNFDRLVCVQCDERTRLAAQRDERAGETMAQGTIRRSFTTSFRQKCMCIGIDSEALQNIQARDAALTELYAMLPPSGKPTEFVDIYTGKHHAIQHEIRQSGGNPSKRRLVPNMLTVDAVMPRHPSQTTNKGFFAHTQGNLVTTTTALNYAKFTHLPGVLAEISQYLNSASPTSSKVMLERVNVLHKLRVKFPYTKKSRSEAADMNAHEKHMQECISGKLVAGETGVWDVASLRWTSERIPLTSSSIWNEETLDRIAKLSKQIEKAFGKTLERAFDGAPYPGFPGTMPSNWNWNALACFSDERLERMRIHCNKYWETKDTPESLCVEMIYQACDDNYGDALGLPVVLLIQHPLRLSIAHKHHGSQMFTGWPPHPTDITQRDDSSNNILMETWYWNVTKMDMDERYYDEAQEQLRSINMPLKYYNPSLPAPTDVDEALATLPEITEVQDFPGEELRGIDNTEGMVTEEGVSMSEALQREEPREESDDLYGSDSAFEALLQMEQKGKKAKSTPAIGGPPPDPNPGKDYDIYRGGTPVGDAMERDDKHAREIAGLHEEYIEIRRYVAREHFDVFAENFEIDDVLNELKEHALNGDRDGYSEANIRLQMILHD